MIAPPSLCGAPQLVEDASDDKKKDDGVVDSDKDEDDVGDPVYPIRRFTFKPETRTSANEGLPPIELAIRAYVQLPPTDALSFLDDTERESDRTGLMCWSGSATQAQFFVDHFYCHRWSATTTTTTTATATATATVSEASAVDVEATKHAEELTQIDTVVELGCGSGLLGLVAAAVFRPQRVFLTDGNAEAAQLANANFVDNVEVLQKLSGAEVPLGGGGIELPWSTLSLADGSRFFERTKSNSLLICGGDIVYVFETIGPLVEAVHSLAVLFCSIREQEMIEAHKRKVAELEAAAIAKAEKEDDADEGEPSAALVELPPLPPPPTAHFFVTFFPRAWFVGQNTILLENVQDKLVSLGWSIELSRAIENDGKSLHFRYVSPEFDGEL